MRDLAALLLLAAFSLAACNSGTAPQPSGDKGVGPATDGSADRTTTPGSESWPSGKEAGFPVDSGGGGCKKDTDCAPGLSCCGTSCVDTTSDVNHCGGCGKACSLGNADATCSSGTCKVKTCKPGYLDCDQKPDNGCETPAGDAGTCACVPKSTQPCYTGPSATEGVGPCKGGVRTCNDTGTGWGSCVGEVTPQPDRCDNSIDDNCDGILNNGFPTAAGCGCLPKSEQPCYSGPTGTAGKGTCKEGKQICSDDGASWGPCQGEVLPQPLDSCLNSDDEDCDGIVNNGFAKGAPGCVCPPGDTQTCYEGPAGTLGKGTCKGGTKTCDASGTAWGLCLGQVKPSLDLCNNGLDEDCDGTADNPPDMDGDGWNVCQGDCCDTTASCSDPKLVNPGAMEVAGNNVDDDCDGLVDNVPAPCDVGLASDSNNPLDYAKAIDLCQFTVENPTNPADKKWGVISAQLLRADGTGTPATVSRSIRGGFGASITPLKGSSLAVLSTGASADSNDTNPSFAAFQGGRDNGVSSGFPADWLAANAGKLPNAPGCPGITAGTAAIDPVMFKLRLRVPTNAQSFSVKSYFFSAEYPEWVCSPWNDFFVALLDSSFKGTPANPVDKNLAFYDPPPDGPPYYPVGVNLAFGNTGLFRQCLNGPTGCTDGSVPGTCNTCLGIGELIGTGFDILKPPPKFPLDPGWCGNSNRAGGGTGWLTTKGNVAPGEVIEIRFALWDTSDPWYDSVVLLDNWTWSLNASKPGTD